MPTRQFPATTDSQKFIDYNSERTALALVNMDDEAIMYFSDDTPVTTTNGFLIFPETYVTLDRARGWRPEKAYYVIADRARNLGIWEAFGETEEEKQAKHIKVSPQEPGRY